MRVSPEFLSLIFASALKGTIILALAALAATWLRRGSAASRHLTWQLGLIGVLVLPLAIALFPTEKQLRLIPTLPFMRDVTSAQITTAPAPLSPDLTSSAKDPGARAFEG